MRCCGPSRSDFCGGATGQPPRLDRRNLSEGKEVVAERRSTTQPLATSSHAKEVEPRGAVRQEMQTQRALQGQPGRMPEPGLSAVCTNSSAITSPGVIEWPHVQTSIWLNRDTLPCWPRSKPA